jgi:hypothetical protein
VRAENAIPEKFRHYQQCFLDSALDDIQHGFRLVEGRGE